MRVILWNCKMRFRDDLEKAFKLNPDILVISECEEIDRLKLPRENITNPTDQYWIGDNQHKGLAVFTFNGYKIDLYKNYSHDFKYILPLRVSRDDEVFHVVGVWTKKVGDKVKGHNNYIRQVHLSMLEYDEFVSNNNVIICGDFNSNLIWERTGIDNNHQVVLDQLAEKEIYSSYHQHFNEEQGKETQATYYHFHKKDRPFHIDFCFMSKRLLDNITHVELGSFEEWSGLSDHVPMIVDF